MQLQYHVLDPEDGQCTDEILFRRLQPGIEAGLDERWTGKIVWEMGKSRNDNEIELKDVYVMYTGLGMADIMVGNFNMPFSREMLTSSKRQHLVERTFVGDHNYGTPSRGAGLRLGKAALEKKLEFSAALSKIAIDPDAKKLDFESPVILEDDFNEGTMAGARMDFHPLGHLSMSQGNFDDNAKTTIGIAGYAWNNDDDNNTRTENGMDTSTDHAKPDVDAVTGLEISGAFRGYGFSLDAQYNRFHAKTMDSALSKGIYQNGETDLINMAFEGGYMLIPGRLEGAAGYECQDADGYDEKWTRTSLGLNLFFKNHDIKIQGTWRMGKNIDGINDNDVDEIFLQTQYLF
jgi:hypothetical protein